MLGEVWEKDRVAPRHNPMKLGKLLGCRICRFCARSLLAKPLENFELQNYDWGHHEWSEA